MTFLQSTLADPVHGSLATLQDLYLRGGMFAGRRIETEHARCLIRIDIRREEQVDTALAFVTPEFLITGIVSDDEIEISSRPPDDLVLWIQMVTGMKSGVTERSSDPTRDDARTFEVAEVEIESLVGLSVLAAEGGEVTLGDNSKPPRQALVSMKWIQTPSGDLGLFLDRNPSLHGRSKAIPVSAEDLGIRIAQTVEASLGVQIPGMRISDRLARATVGGDD